MHPVYIRYISGIHSMWINTSVERILTGCIQYTLQVVYPVYPVYTTDCICIRYTGRICIRHTLQVVSLSGINYRVYLYLVYITRYIRTRYTLQAHLYLVYTTGCICIRYKLQGVSLSGKHYRVYPYPVYATAYRVYPVYTKGCICIWYTDRIYIRYTLKVVSISGINYWVYPVYTTGCICIRYTGRICIRYTERICIRYTLQVVSGVNCMVYLYPLKIQGVSVSCIHYIVYLYPVWITGCICIRYKTTGCICFRFTLQGVHVSGNAVQHVIWWT